MIIALLKAYRFVSGALLGPTCRFEPTCSAYAIEALQSHGCFNGCYLTLRRLLCCHPWHVGGIDLVPAKKER